MRLSSIVMTTRGAGDRIAVGRCGKCHRVCGLSTANRTGVRCGSCKIQYGANGEEVSRLLTVVRLGQAGGKVVED